MSVRGRPAAQRRRTSPAPSVEPVVDERDEETFGRVVEFRDCLERRRHGRRLLLADMRRDVGRGGALVDVRAGQRGREEDDAPCSEAEEDGGIHERRRREKEGHGAVARERTGSPGRRGLTGTLNLVFTPGTAWRLLPFAVSPFSAAAAF